MIIAGAVAFLLSSAVSAYSAIQQGETGRSQARAQARIGEQQAEFARQAAAADAETRRRQFERVLGTQRARFGASGVLASEGSPLLVMMQSEEEAALDVARIQHGGIVAAQGLRFEADLLRRQGRQIQRQARLQATGALLQGVSGAASLTARRTPSRPSPNSIPTPDLFGGGRYT